MTRPHLVLFGGFLGAGKTSAARAFADYLLTRGLRPGFVTNDQGPDLVDTALLRCTGLPTEEVAGGCFCCRYDQLTGAVSRLIGTERPDLILAEPVGSCTDLVATVAAPIQRLEAERLTVAPLSVLIDPLLARPIFGLDGGGSTFSEDLRYLYRKQLEEADFLVINKSDLLDQARLDELEGTLREAFPAGQPLRVSVRQGTGLERWFHRLVFEQRQPRPTMEVDYDRYATGEAQLGWLNAELTLTATPAIDGDMALATTARALGSTLATAGAQIGHLKLSLESGGAFASINQVGNGRLPELGAPFGSRVSEGRLLLNLRAQAPPSVLSETLERCLEELSVGGISLKAESVHCFSPARPEPTHRE
jgi:G3E family GTPase